MIEGHHEFSIHERNDSVENIFCGNFSRPDMKQNVREFYRRVFELYHNPLRGIIPLSIATALSGQELNEVFEVDILHMYHSNKG